MHRPLSHRGDDLGSGGGFCSIHLEDPSGRWEENPGRPVGHGQQLAPRLSTLDVPRGAYFRPARDQCLSGLAHSTSTFTMPEVVETLADLPLGSHALSLHADPEEAAVNAAEFVSGAPEGQAVAYWVPDAPTADLCARQFSVTTPEHVGCVAILPHEQVEFDEGKLRPVAEVREFIRAHPEGVTAAGETLSHYWSPGTMPEHMEYEAWFESQPRDSSRFLCPYDLRLIPPHQAPSVLRDLGAHHSHVALSHSADVVVQLLQLFVFDTVQDLPPRQSEFFTRAVEGELVVVHESTGIFEISPAGEALVSRWSEDVRVGSESASASTS